ncbi:MAG TPA: hypothetical protein VK491_00190 [Gemmatimonadaceae bacterium]|nr:hypothetical protein [Gemmatimonadaceae bacterium]
MFSRDDSVDPVGACVELVDDGLDP